MVKRAGIATLSNLVDSASEDECQQAGAGLILTPNSGIENIAPTRRKVGRPRRAATKETDQKQAVSRTKESQVMASKPTAAANRKGSKRAALAEKPNPTDTEDANELENDDDNDEEPTRGGAQLRGSKNAKVAGRGGRSRQTRSGQAKGTTGRGTAGTVGDVEEEDVAEVAQQSKLASHASSGNKRSRVSKQPASVEPVKVIPETQPDIDTMEVDIDPLSEREAFQATGSRETLRRTGRTQSATRQPPASVNRRRHGSVSDAERSGTEPALRRKLGDLTKRFESLDLKYRNLREVGMRDAESNFDKLKKATDERAKAQDDLIGSLRREVTIQKGLGAEARSLQGQVGALTAEKEKLASDNKNLSKSLADAQAEVKSLSAKLAAARAAQTSAQRAESVGPKAPGSAVKGTTQRPTAAGNSEAVKEAQRNQLKEELYRDLTGLVILGVKTTEDEHIYDCIQTGRNGTLHFHLSIAAQDRGGKSSVNYEDSEYEYTPLLDENRDGPLLELLPDCLKEDICFPGNQAAKFYIRIFDSMTKKVEFEE